MRSELGFIFHAKGYLLLYFRRLWLPVVCCHYPDIPLYIKVMVNIMYVCIFFFLMEKLICNRLLLRKDEKMLWILHGLMNNHSMKIMVEPASDRWTNKSRAQIDLYINMMVSMIKERGRELYGRDHFWDQFWCPDIPFRIVK